MAHEQSGGGCEVPPYTINIPYALYQSIRGNYFLGQSKMLVFGDRRHAWAGLFNPPGSQVAVHINVYTVSNYTPYPFAAQIWFNPSVHCQFKVSNKVSSANTAIRPVPRPQARLHYAESTMEHPEGGVNPASQIVPARSSLSVEKEGIYIIPPGGSFLVYLVPPGACLVRGRVAFGWWEAECED